MFDPRPRQDLIDRLQETLAARVRVEESKLYAQLAKLVASLSVDDDGKFRATTGNMRTQARTADVMVRFQSTVQRTLLPWLVRAALRLVGANAAYFRGVAPLREKAIRRRATDRLLLRLGVVDDQIQAGSWLDSLAGASTVKLNVVTRFSSAVAGGANARAFAEKLADDFTGQQGTGGIVSRFVDQEAGSLFMNVDREVQNVYRDDLRLEHALYSGTRMATTRSFCARRYGLVYTLAEINSWNDLKWDGKIEGADVKSVAGGYRCRHHLNWMTQVAAEALADRIGKPINSYRDAA